MGLKELYYSAEDKYYEVIDAIDKKIPITKITDKIDAVIPSFIVLILLVLLLIGLIVLPFIFPSEEDKNYVFSVTVKNEKGNALEGIQAKIFFDENANTFTTNSKGIISSTAKKEAKIKIEISTTGYEEYTTEFTLETNNKKINVTLKELPDDAGPTEATLRFKDKNGKYITKTEITVRLSCRNSSVTPNPSTVKTTTGEITIKIPKNCEKLYVDSVQVQGYENWFGPINSAVETIVLQEEEIYFQELGDLRIIVKNPEEELLNGIEVKLMKGTSKISEETTETGIAYFTGIETGYYDVLLQDPTLTYEIKKIYSVEITQEKVNEKIVKLDLTQNETLKINVFDKEDGSLIPNAKVILEDVLGEIVGEGNTGEEADTVEFALHSVEGLTVKVSAEGYLPETVEIGEETEIDVELEIITSENSGKLLINLVDEDGKKVINAKVFLKDQDGSILTEYPEKVSDANGSVKYNGIKEGKYYAYAVKFPASGTSEEFEIHLTEETIIEFVLTIGNAVINLQTVDSDKEAIPNTRVKVKSLDEEKEYALDGEGKTTITIKADKKVFFEFSDPSGEYSSYTTKEYTLYPKEYNITAVMQELVIGEDLEVEFLGLFNGTEEATEIVGGEKYTAKLKLIIPSNANYETAGIHFRTGNDENPFLENDFVWLEKINASAATKTKGKTWNPPKGQGKDFDSDNLASSNAKAKWANITWRNPKPGIYEAEIEIKIKENANEPIRIHFRAWGSKARAYYYYPSDNTLGESSETASKQGLYAQTFEKEFNPEELIVIPNVPICNEEICLLGQKMTDLTEEPFLIQRNIPFKTKSNGLYEYQFKIVNNSETVYQEPELWISLVEGNGLETEKAVIQYYEIKTAQGASKKNTLVNSNKTSGISLGLFQNLSSIEGKIGIKTIEPGNIFINLLLVQRTGEGGNTVYDSERKIQVKILALKELEISAKPELIPAYAVTPITITVKDKDEVEVEEASVTMSIVETQLHKILVETKKTDRKGEVVFNSQQWEPGTEIEFEAKKFNYQEATAKIEISGEVFELEPLSIEETLTTENSEIRKNIIIKNLLEETSLTIKKVTLTDNVKGSGYLEYFINKTLMTNKLESFENELIEPYPKEFLGTEMFIAKLKNALQEESYSAEGLITIKLENPAFDKATYSKDIDLSLSYGMGEKIAENKCLVIETGQTTFSKQTTTQLVQLEYSIINSCRDNAGTPISVKNLRAKITWRTAKKGSVLLNLDGTAKTLTYLLTDSLFASTVDAGKEIIGVLTYTPDPEFTGDEGVVEFSVVIQAEINTAQGTQEIHTAPNSIDGRIGNIDLTECITFTPEADTGIKIESGAEEGQFSIVNGCGIDIDILLCDKDPGCSGGTGTVGLTLNPDTKMGHITIRKDSTKQINVSRADIPGIYAAEIKARKNSAEAFRKIAMYDVLVEPEEEHYFSLNNYSLAIIDLGVPEVIALTNNYLFKKVTVNASDCAWKTAQENKGFWYEHDLADITLIVWIGRFLCSLFCSDPCEKRTDVELYDYLINLAGGGKNPKPERNLPNLVDINLNFSGINESDWIKIDWPFEKATYTYGVTPMPPGKEILPLMITKKTSAHDNIEPVYGILTIEATEHNQTDSLHVPGDNDDYASNLIPWGLPDKYVEKTINEIRELITGKPVDINITGWRGMIKFNWPLYNNDLIPVKRQFHVRAITKTFVEEIPPLTTSLDCVRPDGIGGTGEQALPKIKFDWEWNSITEFTCDETNPNSIYCDSAQFSVMLSKRIHAIDEFMQGNGYTFSCPKSAAEVAIGNVAANSFYNDVEDEKIGIKQVNVTENNNKTRVTTIIENKRNEKMSVTVQTNITVPEGINYSGETKCSKNTGDIASGSTKEVYCEFELPETENKMYGLKVKHFPEDISESEAEKYDPNIVQMSFKPANENSSTCYISPTTGVDEKTGIFVPEAFINAYNGSFAEYVTQDTVNFDGGIVQTDSAEIVNVINAIKTLSHFNVYLIKDGFSEDFKADFAEYYENKAFFEGATWFTDSNPDTKSNELAEYFKTEGRLSFYRKYLTGKEYSLPEPGLYHVDLIIDYSGDEWNLFDSQGKPRANIKVEFTRLATPKANSIFYYLPFDGKIGEENGAYHRIGYGTGYNNLSNEQIKLNSEIFLYPSNTTGIPLNEISINRIDSLSEMNSKQETRGSIFRLDYLSKDNMQMNFYPSKATPVAFKMYHTQTALNEEIRYYYAMKENNVPVLGGINQLAYWNGMGECRDFEGRFLADYSQWDEKSDNINFQNQYFVSWNNAVQAGNTYLKTVFYTPIERDIKLTATQGDSAMNSSFYTPDDFDSPIVGLNGIQGMRFNDSSSNTTDYLQNIQNVFDLVKEGSACIMQNDVSVNVYWNEPSLFRQTSTSTINNKSLKDFEDSLSAGSTCIG